MLVDPLAFVPMLVTLSRRSHAHICPHHCLRRDTVICKDATAAKQLLSRPNSKHLKAVSLDGTLTTQRSVTGGLAGGGAGKGKSMRRWASGSVTTKV